MSEGLADTALTRDAGIEVPLLCGAMYPCSNPELVAAASDAGGMGIIQPISMTYVHGHDLREGIRLIRGITPKPIGFNAIVEQSAKLYLDRMRGWIDVALEEGVRFFITALGNPRWVVERVHAVGGIVYHDVTTRTHAQKALDGGVDGLICVNRRAGGHAGTTEPRALHDELRDLGVPLVCAGGIGDPSAFVEALRMGYAGVQLGTRFIATTECKAHPDYKAAIVRAKAEDIVLTEKISGVPVAVIETEHIRKVGTKAGPVMRRMLRHPKLKHYARMFYSVQSLWQLKRASLQGMNYRDYFQAGQSVEGIDEVLPAGEVVRRFAAALRPSARSADA
ncbi:NAD(P)H-dependent flavin oxidoreductase [Paraliomyxa miuraensis]|uniref:NAD(P)H-dependent flavin oxidoreductase n=1 Tax=Paraliomyxa miuraensis TaxID=376150 RepID=UPI0022576FCC|nr:nitronate monooxygenase [Paraliomyxa miuraensis]MCX4240678.1 nitronate monooxygenase [Paraliomyxa miuraensis]